jgi:hypothetical protein
MTTRALEQTAPASALAILDGAVAARARYAIRHWLDRTTSIEVRVQPESQPALRRTAQGLTLDLRHDWLTRVWGRDLTIVGDVFTLDAHDVADNTHALTVATLTGSTKTLHIKLEPTEPGPTRVAHR